MTMCKYSSLVSAVVLCACTSAPRADHPAMVQNAVFVAGDGAAPVTPANVADRKATSSMTEPSALRRLYWNLGGR